MMRSSSNGDSKDSKDEKQDSVARSLSLQAAEDSDEEMELESAANKG